MADAEASPFEGKLRSPARPFGKQRSIVPGFGLTFGFTIFYLCLIVLIPLSAVFIRSAGLGSSDFVAVGFSARALAAYRLSFGAAAAAAAVNGVFGLLIAWVLVRYDFPGKRLVSAMVDLPFALPTAVAGIALTALYADNGWLGQYLEPLGHQGRLSPRSASSSRWSSSACRSSSARSSRCSPISAMRSRKPPPRSAPAGCRRSAA